eukprot:scaffold10128_cov60-Phaeocystis_antarctica.AAC.3
MTLSSRESCERIVSGSTRKDLKLARRVLDRGQPQDNKAGGVYATRPQRRLRGFSDLKWGVKGARYTDQKVQRLSARSTRRARKLCFSLWLEAPDRPPLFPQEAYADIGGREDSSGKYTLLQPKSSPFLSPLSWTCKTRAPPEPRPSPEMRHPPPRSDQAALHGEPPHYVSAATTSRGGGGGGGDTTTPLTSIKQRALRELHLHDT